MFIIFGNSRIYVQYRKESRERCWSRSLIDEKLTSRPRRMGRYSSSGIPPHLLQISGVEKLTVDNATSRINGELYPESPGFQSYPRSPSEYISCTLQIPKCYIQTSTSPASFSYPSFCACARCRPRIFSLTYLLRFSLQATQAASAAKANAGTPIVTDVINATFPSCDKPRNQQLSPG